MNRNRFIYWTDLVLIPAFVLSLYTGIELHLAGHGTEHEVWHNWAAFHVIISLLFTLLTCIHIKSHWKRYKRLAIQLLTIAFLSVVITGFGLFFIHGANSSLGIFHYQNGLIASIFILLHVFKRKQFLARGFTFHVLGKRHAEI